MSLNKIKHDVKFYNTETMEVECTHNQCHKKFVQKTEEGVLTPKWNNSKPIKFERLFHECSKCGRKYHSKKDQSQSKKNYLKKVGVI